MKADWNKECADCFLNSYCYRINGKLLLLHHELKIKIQDKEKGCFMHKQYPNRFTRYVCRII